VVKNCWLYTPVYFGADFHRASRLAVRFFRRLDDHHVSMVMQRDARFFDDPKHFARALARRLEDRLPAGAYFPSATGPAVHRPEFCVDEAVL